MIETFRLTRPDPYPTILKDEGYLRPASTAGKSARSNVEGTSQTSPLQKENKIWEATEMERVQTWAWIGSRMPAGLGLRGLTPCRMSSACAAPFISSTPWLGTGQSGSGT